MVYIGHLILQASYMYFALSNKSVYKITSHRPALPWSRLSRSSTGPFNFWKKQAHDALDSGIYRPKQDHPSRYSSKNTEAQSPPIITVLAIVISWTTAAAVDDGWLQFWPAGRCIWPCIKLARRWHQNARALSARCLAEPLSGAAACLAAVREMH